VGKSGQGLDGHMGLAEIAPQGDGFSICGAGFVKLFQPRMGVSHAQPGDWFTAIQTCLLPSFFSVRRRFR
jgi:hypothetical protein